MTELEKAEILVDYYLKKCQLSTDSLEKSWIERMWQDYLNRGG